MSVQQFTVDASAKANYDNAANAVAPFEPTEWLIRTDATSAAEVILSFDGKTDAIQLALPANQGCMWVHFRTRAAQVWVKRASNATAIAWLVAKTDS